MLEQLDYCALLIQYMPKVIENEEEYQKALEDIQKLMKKKERSKEEGAILQLLSILVEKYEPAIEGATPVQVLKHLMSARGLKQKDLVGVIGSKGNVSTIVSGAKPISKERAKKLAAFFNVSAELFI